MPTIIGLDLGTQRAKTAVIRGRAGRLRVADYHERTLPATSNREEWLKALAPAVEGLSRDARLGGTSPVVVIPGQLAILRTVTVPFTRRPEIEAVLPAQVESELPMPVEEVVMDYEVVRQDNGESDLFLAAVPRAELRQILAILSASGIEPRAITLDLFAVACAASQSGHEIAMENALVLDLGAGATKAIFLRNGKLVDARAFRLGGQTLTNAIENGLGVGAEAAETMKEETENLNAVSSEKLKSAVGAMYGRVAREARMFLASLGETGSTDAVVLTGGGAIMGGTEDLLRVGAEDVVRRLELPSGTEVPARLLGDRTPPGAVLAPILGSVLPFVDTRLPSHQFRLADVVGQGKDSLRGAVAVALTLTTALLAILGLHFQRSVQAIGTEIEKVERAKGQVWADVFPGGQPLPKLRSIERLSQRVDELEAQVQRFTDAPEKRSALLVLYEILRCVPAETNFTLQRMTVSPAAASLTGETDSLKSVMVIEASINASPFLSCKLNNADKLAQRTQWQTKKVRFQFEIKPGPSDQVGRVP